MASVITKEQFEEIEGAYYFDLEEYHKVLEKHTGIIAKPYRAFSYYDSAGDYIGDSFNCTPWELLKSAYVEVADNG